MALLEAGVGVALLPRSTKAPDTLLRLMVDKLELNRTVYLYGVAGRQRTAVASTLMKMLRACDWSRYAVPAPSTTMTPKPVTIAVDETQRVSGLLQHPRGARACYVLAHGAGAGMTHPFMTAIADGLAERGIATLRYQFPYMEQGGKRPDAPKLAQATVRAAVAEAARLMPKLALIAGGKSFGGRMTSQAQAEAPLAQRARPRLPRLSAACGGPPLRGARGASLRGEDPHAVPARDPRCARRHRADAQAC